ncbi:MAG: secretin N-terminal domain-containing protein [Fimbriimonadaceae bacterium]
MREYLSKLAVAVALFVTMVAPAAAQFTTGSEVPSRPAWEQFKLDANKRVQLNFRNASVDPIIDLLSKQSGIAIIKDPKFTQRLTVSSPKAVSLKEAFEIFNAAIGLANFEMRKEGNLLVIRERRERGGMGDMTPEQIQQMMGGGRSRTVLRVYKVEYAAASEVARVVNEVFAAQQQSNNPFAFMQQFGNRGGRGGRGGTTGFSGFNFGGGSEGPEVRASSDDFSNSVIVNAAESKQREVEDLIKEIDKQTEQPQETKVYPLTYADATEVALSVQNVLASSQPTGRGANSGRNNDIFSRFQTAARFGSSQAAFGTVTSDLRTNSLIVTATKENHTVVAEVVKELDRDVEYVNAATVIPLGNARADDVASLLNQAFGNSRNGGQTRQNNNTGRANTNANRNQGNQGGGNQGGGNQGGREAGASIPDPDPAEELALDTGLDGELMTSVQFRGGLNFGGQQQQNQGATGRSQDGRIVNTRQTAGNVTIIADPNTNSIIVVGDPENAAVVQSVLGQLDKIPEQVVIETVIVEATVDKSQKLGVEWNLANGTVFGSPGTSGSGGSDFGLQTNPLPEGFRYSVTGGNIGGFLNALNTDDRFQVLSTPKIFTSNNVEAEINISQSVPFIVSQREDVNGNFIFNYSFQDVGIVLNVTPRITANGMVTLDVLQTANDLQGFTDFNAPIVNQRQASTTVSVQDGLTVVLGGIMRSQVTSRVKKLPILGDIPILGELFKSRSKQEVKTELLVFLTPRVVRNQQQASQVTNDEAAKLSPSSQKKVREALSTTTELKKKPPVKK